MLELASLVIELTGSRSRIVHRQLPQDDPRQRRPDISKANDVLGWAPQTPLREGLIRTIEYWDIERQRRPQSDHRAVIVAENITSRFFNVLRLLNRSVPVILFN